MSKKLPPIFVSKCPNNECPGPKSEPGSLERSLKVRQFVRKGYFWRKDDSKRIPRYRCIHCNHSFSSSTLSPRYWQKKRSIHPRLRLYHAAGVSQRRAALILKVDRKTIERHFVFLGLQAVERLVTDRQERVRSGKKLTQVQMDEMQSFERSKCLPLSIPLAVEPNEREILGFKVCSMPANGPLAAISRQKYGPREDQREEAFDELLGDLLPFVAPDAEFLTDKKPEYPIWIEKRFPEATHKTTKGGRGAVIGQGELKKLGFDPLFSLNHSAAMFRANINRLFRRTWCTTKKSERLALHIALYVVFHNHVLLRRGKKGKAKSQAATINEPIPSIVA